MRIRLGTVCVLVLFIVVTTAGCVRFGAQQRPENQLQILTQSPEGEEVTLTLYYSNRDASGIITETRSVSVPAGTEPIAAAIEELGKEPANPEGLVMLPLDTKVLGVTVAGDTITINFNEKLRDNFYGGSMSEAILITTIINTATEFAGYENYKVQFLVNGEIVETIGGHMAVDEPLQRN